MADTFALPILFQAVKDRFTADSSPIENLFGWREPRKQSNAVRILWVPGDENGNTGKVQAPRQIGRHPRPLATLPELCTVHIVANDPTTPENELAQYTAVRAVFDAWYRAIYLAAYGTFQIISTKWNRTKLERRHGAAMTCVLAIEAMIPDKPFESEALTDLAPVDTHAEININLDTAADDVVTTEQITTEETP